MLSLIYLVYLNTVLFPDSMFSFKSAIFLFSISDFLNWLFVVFLFFHSHLAFFSLIKTDLPMFQKCFNCFAHISISQLDLGLIWKYIIEKPWSKLVLQCLCVFASDPCFSFSLPQGGHWGGEWCFSGI